MKPTAFAVGPFVRIATSPCGHDAPELSIAANRLPIVPEEMSRSIETTAELVVESIPLAGVGQKRSSAGRAAAKLRERSLTIEPLDSTVA